MKPILGVYFMDQSSSMLPSGNIMRIRAEIKRIIPEREQSHPKTLEIQIPVPARE